GRHEKRLRRAGGPLGERISFHDLVPNTVEAHDTPFPTIVLEALPEPGTQVEPVVPPMRLHEDVRVEHVQNRRLVPHSSACICSTNLSNVLPRSPVSMCSVRWKSRSSSSARSSAPPNRWLIRTDCVFQNSPPPLGRCFWRYSHRPQVR